MRNLLISLPSEAMKLMYDANDISMLIGVSMASAYRIIRRINEELSNEGKIVIRGKVPRNCFYEKLGIDESNITKG